MPRSDLNRVSLVEAAADLADKCGLEELTLKAIANHFRIKPPSLYNHIGNLAALRRQLQLKALRGLTSRLARATAGRSEADATRQLAKAWRTFAREHPGLYAAMTRVAADGDEEMEGAADDLRDLVQAALSGYELEGSDVTHAARAVCSAIHGFIALEAARAPRSSVEPDQAFIYLVEVIIAGLRGKTRGGADKPRRDPAAADSETKTDETKKLQQIVAKRKLEGKWKIEPEEA